ncbi:hypothetical protein [Streptomyces sp. NBC_00207]|uniref:hypothetical protein n=1 Tax=unclassified Streptomyces TaxID=2593676 RepID=UPI003243F950
MRRTLAVSGYAPTITRGATEGMIMYQAKDPDRLERAVARYLLKGKKQAKQERKYFRSLPSFHDVVRIAGAGNIREGVRHEHLENVDAGALIKYRDALLDELDALQRATVFEELYGLLWDARIRGIGPVTVYDTAVSAGAWLRLRPDVVYLHAGTLLGARALGVPKDAETVDVEELPETLHKFSAGQVEDILCEYHKVRSADFAEQRKLRRERRHI